MVLFPHVAMPLLVGRAGSLAAIQAAAEGRTELILVTQRDADVHVPGPTDLHRIGVIARLQQVTRLPNGTTKILVESLGRIRVQRFLPTHAAKSPSDKESAVGEREPVSDLLQARVTEYPLSADDDEHAEDTRVQSRHALSLFEEYAGLQRRMPSEIVGLLQGIDDPVRQAYGIAAHLQLSIEKRQRLLEAPTLRALVQALVEVIGGELDLLRLERKIDEQVRGSLFQNQREFFLQEQLKAIHKELGQDDGDDLRELELQIESKGLPEAVAIRAQREFRKLRRTSPMSPESAVSRGWLDWTLSLPWKERSDDTIDLVRARQILDADHYGLEEVKERILDHIAVLARVGTLPGPILCLVGPPGVGKTSLGRSIANALGRRFVRMALGGVRDEAEIRGHRRTYIGAMPGRIIQAMRKAEVVNPLVLLDEVDKLGSDWRGDPSAALLEVLDPEQNHAFTDHYLEVDYDLSQVMFVTTANTLSSIPEPLRDRMEVIRLPGYLESEKLIIGQRYLLPRQLTLCGLDASDVSIAPEVLPAVIREWTREAGVRELERRIARLARKLARRATEAQTAATRAQLASGAAGSNSNGKDTGAKTKRKKMGAPVAAAPPTLAITRADLPDLLGPAPFEQEDPGLRDQVGVASGLAYTSVGGELLEIEVSVVPGRGRLQLTGTLGDVMKESAAAALSYVRARAEALGIPPDFHRTRDIHVHLPAGATPKDGPSAGIALATALASALSGIPVRGDVAMTGEITLRGRVLPVGGIREKGVAAHRHHVAHVIVPAGNVKDLSELPVDVREQVTWHPVRTMDDVIALALRHAPIAEAVPAGSTKRSKKRPADHLVVVPPAIVQQSIPEQTMRPTRGTRHRRS